MGKKTPTMKKANVAFRSLSSMTLREESSGKRQINDAKSLLKLDHLRNVGTWASGEACALPLGAFFGNRLAALEESLGSRPDPTLFTCEKCESEIQPSYNLTVRIEKNAAKTRRRRKKEDSSMQRQ